MYKIFIPQDKGKHKTPARGFWRNPAGKVYYDYLTIQTYQDDNVNTLYSHLERLRRFYQQEAIFFIDEKKNVAHVFSGPQNIIDLSQRIIKTIPRDKKTLRHYVKRVLSIYGGITVYCIDGVYTLEAWQ